MGIPEGQKIPQAKLEAATHSSDTEKRNDAIRAKTMEGWHKGARTKSASIYDHPRRA
jgi:hypothetical protein